MIIKPQVIIPMSGVGKRFVDAGYYNLKPLINVGNSRLIDELMNMFPGIDDPLFIISKNHKQRNELYSYLKEKWPNSEISEIDSHKLGPGHAIFESKNFIDVDRPSIVSYCDFSGNWDFNLFCEELNNVDSLVLTYTGFNPHMLRNTKYAYVQKNSEGLVTAIQEKSSFTDFPVLEEASAGLYAFSTGALLLDALSEQIQSNGSHMGEFYISLTIIPLLAKKLRVKTFLMEKFAQFGTPEDLKDWEYLYRSINSPENKIINNSELKAHENSIILAGGIGSRLSDFSEIPKPFIKIKEKALWKHSESAAVKSDRRYLVIRKEFVKYIEENNENETKILELNYPTQGQADTALYALNNLDLLPGPVTFLSCDNVISEIDFEKARELLRRSDLVVWTAPEYPMSRYKPNRYSWVNTKNSKVTGFSLKNLPESFNNPSMIIGNFTFKSKEVAQKLINECFRSAERFNSEIYLDSVIQAALESGYEVSAISLDMFFAVGTEDEFKTYKYYSTFKMSRNFRFEI
jgi:NDP-sugar pyrophosphorylase family protein